MSQNAPADPNLIDAMPTKELFIDMLTRDIALVPAIIDLVDNCADGAKSLRGEGDLRGLWVKLYASTNEFRIVDNCGGMSAEVARNYAFRFGRPANAPNLAHSVGQFGVGMKRAIFKMGRHFWIESTAAQSHFILDVDVNQWAQTKEWAFEFDKVEEGGVFGEDVRGTEIKITSLQQDVSEVFALDSFKTILANDLKSKLQDPIARGLAVTLDGIPVNAEPMTMLSQKGLQPVRRDLKYVTDGKKPVVVKLYCGLGRSEMKDEERSDAGWHVFCNGRLILEGDKSSITGWGTKDDVVTIPGFHNQFNYLRGLAFFDCDDSSRLPWNTTKTGLNTDSPIYRAVLLEMRTLMRPVVDFLNALKDEKSGRQDGDEKGPLQVLLDSASPATIDKLPTRSAFSVSISNSVSRPGPTTQKIQYSVPIGQANAVKKALNVSTWKDVGERTFHYFYNSEVDE